MTTLEEFDPPSVAHIAPFMTALEQARIEEGFDAGVRYEDLVADPPKVMAEVARDVRDQVSELYAVERQTTVSPLRNAS